MLEEVDKSSKAANEYYQLLTDSTEKELLKRAILSDFEKSKKRVDELNRVYDSIIIHYS